MNNGKAIGEGWTIVRDIGEWDRAVRMTPGKYQHDILLGLHSVSGSTLKGAARKYASRYADSRKALLTRLEDAGIPVAIERIGHRDILVIG